LLLFYDTNISQGSAATRLRFGLVFYYCFTRNLLLFVRERIMKIGQHLVKLEEKKQRHLFFRTWCISISMTLEKSSVCASLGKENYSGYQ